MKYLVVLFALAAVASAWPVEYYDAPVMKFYAQAPEVKYGESEVFVSGIEKPASSYNSGAFRLITAGQYDLPLNQHENSYPSYSDAIPQLDWKKF